MIDVGGYHFDYEKKISGVETLRLNPTHFRASRLYYALWALRGIKGKVLDVGCGGGSVAEAVKYYRPDLKITGVDISQSSIAKAKKRSIDVNFRVADAQKLLFKDNSFDAVYCLDLIEHVRYPTKALSEISRVLKKGGVFHIFFPTEDNFYTPEGIMIKLGWKGKEIYGGHPHHFTPEKAKAMTKKAGFKIIKSRWGDHFIHQALEIIYFSYLSLRKKKPSYTIEGYISEAKPNIFTSILMIGKSLLATLSFIETMTLFWLPALGLHLTFIKKND